MKRLFLSFAIIVSGCNISSPSQAVEISNFKSGLVCPHYPSKDIDAVSNGGICAETETIHVTGQSRCVYAGKEVPCTWYGFEFDYKNATKDTKIRCDSTTTELADIADTQNVTKENTKTSSYELPIESGAGHFYNPQYSIFSVSSKGETIDRHQTVCSITGIELFRFKFQLVFPAAR